LDDGSDKDEDNEWTKATAKKNDGAEFDPDDDARKLWEEELLQSSSNATGSNGVTAKDGTKSSSLLTDPKGEVQDGDAFLMEFMTHRKWMDNESSGANNKCLGAKLDDASDAQG